MARGFMVDKAHRADRDGACVDTEATMQWAMVHRPGAVPIGGGRKQRNADRLRGAYDRYREQGRRHKGHRKFDLRYKLGRFTPSPRGTFPNPGPSELVVKRHEASSSED